MSEPTPLSAEELAAVRRWKPLTGSEYVEAVRWWLSMSSYRKGKHSRYLATIDAQATEIAILKDGRCVSCMEPVNPLHPKCACIRAEIAEMEAEIAALKGALEREKRSEWREGLVAVIDHEGNYLGCMGTMTWAVMLAGKEAHDGN